MRELSVREANQNFSQVIAAAERGETIVVAKNGRPVAKIIPQREDRESDPERRAGWGVESSGRSDRKFAVRFDRQYVQLDFKSRSMLRCRRRSDARCKDDADATTLARYSGSRPCDAPASDQPN